MQITAKIESDFHIKNFIWIRLARINSEYIIFHVKVSVCSSFLFNSIYMCIRSQCTHIYIHVKCTHNVHRVHCVQLDMDKMCKVTNTHVEQKKNKYRLNCVTEWYLKLKHYFEEFRTEHVFFLTTHIPEWTSICGEIKTRCDTRYNGDDEKKLHPFSELKFAPVSTT